jgi:preprotein translocase subunit SecB
MTAPSSFPESPALPMMIHAQYVRDQSFENPGAPESLRPGQSAPAIEITINMDARPIEDKQIRSLYEVVVALSATARRAGKTVFIAELQYGVSVSLPEIPAEHHHPILLIEIPRLAFPFVRQILANMTQQAGFPPLLMGPVDFQALYAERFPNGGPQALPAGTAAA